MKKEVCFNVSQSFWTRMDRIITYSMLVYFIYVLYYLPGRGENLKVLRHCLRKKNIVEKFLIKQRKEFVLI